jgi:hypothetical protein
MERSVPGRNPPPPKVEWIPPMCGFSLEMHTLRESVKRWCVRVCVYECEVCAGTCVCTRERAGETQREMSPQLLSRERAGETQRERGSFIAGA